MGIEPTLSVWETEVLPLNYICISVGSRAISKPPTKHHTYSIFKYICILPYLTVKSKRISKMFLIDC